MSRQPSPADKANSNARHAHRVIASLNREQVDYLDQLGKDAQFSSGNKLSRTQIIAALVNVLRRLKLTGEGIATPEQFEQRILDVIMQRARVNRRNGNRERATEDR
jgi:hypothetical protein